MRYILLATVTLLLSTSVLAQSLEEKVAAFESGLRDWRSSKGDWTMAERMEHHGVPGVSIAIIEDGKLVFAKGYGVRQLGTGEPIDTETVFSVGSVSKIGNAALILRMADAGLLDLSADVNGYMKRWQVPASEFTKDVPVTLRGILSHSAGLTVWGFPDFQPGERMPTVVETLKGMGAARTQAVRPFYKPGTRWRYSGGGTTVAQLVAEDVTGKDYADLAKEYLFEPLGMNRSTYMNPVPAAHGNIAKAHDRNGQPTALPRGYEAMAELAASGLWSTPSDMAKLIIALNEAYAGNEDGFLQPDTARDMMTNVGISNYGLGPVMRGYGSTRKFEHGGANDSYRAWMEGHLATSSGMVILTNGSNGGPLFAEIRRAIADAFGWPYYQPAKKVEAFPLKTEELAEFAGRYALQQAPYGAQSRRYIGSWDRRTHEEFAMKNGQLWLGSRFPLIPLGPTQFGHAGCIHMNEGKPCFEFIRGISGEIEQVMIMGTDSQSIMATKE